MLMTSSLNQIGFGDTELGQLAQDSKRMARMGVRRSLVVLGELPQLGEGVWQGLYGQRGSLDRGRQRLKHAAVVRSEEVPPRGMVAGKVVCRVVDQPTGYLECTLRLEVRGLGESLNQAASVEHVGCLNLCPERGPEGVREAGCVRARVADLPVDPADVDEQVLEAVSDDKGFDAREVPGAERIGVVECGFAKMTSPSRSGTIRSDSPRRRRMPACSRLRRCLWSSS